MSTVRVPSARSSRSSRSSRISAAVVGVAVAITLLVDGGPLIGLALIFVVIVPFEKLFPRHRQRIRRPHLGTDIAYALVATPLATIGLVVGLVIGVGSLMWIPGLVLRPLVGALPAGARIVIGFLLFEVIRYWGHRCAHEVPVLWRFHRIHHSTEHLDWVSGFRTHPLDGVLFAPPLVMLIAAGFDARATGALVVVELLVGLLVHANVRWRLRPLQRVVVTPEFHHWHHTDHPDAHHTNYSAILPVWDQLFGTYRVPQHLRPGMYGVGGDVSPGLLGQLADPFRGLRNARNSQPGPSGAPEGTGFVHSR